MLRGALVLSLITTGCALYVRPMNTLTPDDHVVLELNDQGIPDMAPKLGSGTFLVGGKLQKMDSTSLVMAVYRTQSTHAILDQPPHSVAWGGETVTVPKFDVASARVERVSGLFVALASVAIVTTGIWTADVLSHPQNPIVLRAWPRP
jgi:hypothetical protein